MDYKIFVAVIATSLVIIGFIPYLSDIFANKTKPHLYTWLIGGITQGTATVALLEGGGKFASVSLILGTFFVFIIFLLSFKYGTKDVISSDKIVLAFALLAVVIWWQLDNPLPSVLMVSAIDGAGYIPTIRKSFKNPWSETLSFWAIMASTDFLTIVSIAEYNLLTVTYVSVIFTANMLVFFICLFRRRVVARPRVFEKQKKRRFLFRVLHK